MPNLDRADTLEKILALKVGAILRADDRQQASRAMRAAVAGGIRLVEFTLNTPGALELIAEFAADEKLVVGAGTVMTPAEATAAIDAGAAYIVSPVCDAEVIAAAHASGAVAIPGTYTPNEMQAAYRAGADLVKLFPAPADIPRYVRQILGPMPYLRIFPTAGVTPENASDILAAGAAGVGLVSSLFTPAEMQSQNYQAIQRRAEGIVTSLV
ncbi:MAG: bifunctional 4-hydroxy-2-oxoglutarate aldolase/2-dehydro-3-deoxy-phosphogluconate aldolase [Phycisphaerae bacterium]